MQFEDIRLSVSESAKLFGLNPKTIRRAISTGELSYIVVRGRYKVSFKSLLKWSQTSTRRTTKLNEQGIGQYVQQWNISNKLFSPHPTKARELKKRSSSN